MNTLEFQQLLKTNGSRMYRHMPWREDIRPYYVLVSELMLQQTQVKRVVPKFETFIDRFPDEYVLAKAPLGEVLKQWQGLGYNRRAKFLHDAAKTIVNERNGIFPQTVESLQALPGVGKNTAGAIAAYSYNYPAIFVETNIRTVYLHHFFDDTTDIDDKQIISLLERTIDKDHPREFYWALMDYGTHLKANGVKNNSASRHYKKQSVLKGSLREMRGMIVRTLTAGTKSDSALNKLYKDDMRFEPALEGLLRDGLISHSNDIYHLTN